MKQTLSKFSARLFRPRFSSVRCPAQPAQPGVAPTRNNKKARTRAPIVTHTHHTYDQLARLVKHARRTPKEREREISVGARASDASTGARPRGLPAKRRCPLGGSSQAERKRRSRASAPRRHGSLRGAERGAIFRSFARRPPLPTRDAHSASLSRSHARIRDTKNSLGGHAQGRRSRKRRRRPGRQPTAAAAGARRSGSRRRSTDCAAARRSALGGRR